MRQVNRMVIRRATGECETATELLPDAGFADRIAHLKASVPVPQPGDIRLLSLSCNGCGASAALDFGRPQLPDGWASTSAGDFCPACALGLS